MRWATVLQVLHALFVLLQAVPEHRSTRYVSPIEEVYGHRVLVKKCVDYVYEYGACKLPKKGNNCSSSLGVCCRGKCVCDNWSNPCIATAKLSRRRLYEYDVTRANSDLYTPYERDRCADTCWNDCLLVLCIERVLRYGCDRKCARYCRKWCRVQQPKIFAGL
ncbi:uncharacterized protein LOC144135180 [Amblyomma americanum]